MNFTGVIPILATPFREDESFDAESMTGMVRLMKRIGVDGVTVLGVLGEANRLGDNEREQVIRTAVDAADGMPVVAGASASGNRAACDLAPCVVGFVVGRGDAGENVDAVLFQVCGDEAFSLAQRVWRVSQ